MPQAPERPQLILGVVEPLGDLEGRGPGRGGVGRRALRLHQRHAPVRRRAASRGARPGPSAAEAGERALDAAATLVHQRQLEPQRHRGDGERHADRRVAARRKGPVQRRPHVVDLAAVRGQPFGGGPRLPFGLGPLEEIPKVFGVASGHLVEFAAVGELLERVGPRRLEQPIARDCARDIRRDQRLRDQVRDAVDDLRRGERRRSPRPRSPPPA